VRVKAEAFPFQEFGMIEGTVLHVGAEANQSDRSAPGRDSETASLHSPNTFKAVIRLDPRSPAFEAPFSSLRAGMQVTGEVVEGNRTLIRFLLSPVQRVLHEAGRER